MSQFDSKHFMKPFFSFDIEGDVLACVLIAQYNGMDIIGWLPSLVKHISLGELWESVGPARSTVWEREFNEHHASPEDWARSDVAAWNLYLADTYGEDADLSAFQRWVKAMNDFYNNLELDDNQLVEPGGES